MRENSKINYGFDSVNETVHTKEKEWHGGIINGKKSDQVKKTNEILLQSRCQLKKKR